MFTEERFRVGYSKASLTKGPGAGKPKKCFPRQGPCSSEEDRGGSPKKYSKDLDGLTTFSPWEHIKYTQGWLST